MSISENYVVEGYSFGPTGPRRKAVGNSLWASWLALCSNFSGVSLFDFAGFDSEDYEARYPISNWREYVPYFPGVSGSC